MCGLWGASGGALAAGDSATGSRAAVPDDSETVRRAPLVRAGRAEICGSPRFDLRCVLASLLRGGGDRWVAVIRRTAFGRVPFTGDAPAHGGLLDGRFGLPRLCSGVRVFTRAALESA